MINLGDLRILFWLGRFRGKAASFGWVPLFPHHPSVSVIFFQLVVLFDRIGKTAAYICLSRWNAFCMSVNWFMHCVKKAICVKTLWHSNEAFSVVCWNLFAYRGFNSLPLSMPSHTTPMVKPRKTLKTKSILWQWENMKTKRKKKSWYKGGFWVPFYFFPFIFVVYGHSEREKRILWGKEASHMES